MDCFALKCCKDIDEILVIHPNKFFWQQWIINYLMYWHSTAQELMVVRGYIETTLVNFLDQLLKYRRVCCEIWCPHMVLMWLIEITLILCHKLAQQFDNSILLTWLTNTMSMLNTNLLALAIVSMLNADVSINSLTWALTQCTTSRHYGCRGLVWFYSNILENMPKQICRSRCFGQKYFCKY